MNIPAFVTGIPTTLAIGLEGRRYLRVFFYFRYFYNTVTKIIKNINSIPLSDY